MRGLDPYRNYFIQVTAVTSSGRSPPSDPLSVITDTAPSSSPLNLELTKITPRSARLEWEPPEMFYKNIDSYTVDMRKDDKLLRSESTKDTKIDLSDLEPGQLIVLRVFAVTRSLYGRKEYEGEFAQLVFTTPPEATTSSRLTNTPPVRRTTSTPTKHTTFGKHTTNLTSKPRAMYGAPRALLQNIARLYRQTTSHVRRTTNTPTKHSTPLSGKHTTNVTSKPRAMYGAPRTLLQNIARLYRQTTSHVRRTTNTPTKHTTSGKHTTNVTSKPRAMYGALRTLLQNIARPVSTPQTLTANHEPCVAHYEHSYKTYHVRQAHHKPYQQTTSHVRRTTNTPTKHSTPLSGRTTTRRPYKPRGTNSDRIASRTAVAKLNWLRSGTREQVAQTKLAKLMAEVAKLEKVKLELEIAKLSPNCLKPMLGSDKVETNEKF
ncbi:hypothetical protein RRG08_025139 [Elysia crispata]|uniref:Fibronectin type-III domain-containing protein n=1 Tax=Elysia crispata TaxID=231223 RepID=A0AAE0YBT9_9GAST|nr:hypothetical protein RRG08_025139 [Elysia crispata]